jgi:transposase-like protein
VIKEYISDRVFDGTRKVSKERAEKLKSKSIRSLVVKLEKEVAKAQKKLDDFRNKCSHPTLTYKNEGDTGSWDRNDSYWRVWKCHDCGKRWVTEQDYKTEKKYPHAIDITNLGYEGKQMLEKLKGINLE